MAGKAGRRGFGYVRKLPSGAHQASYNTPAGLRVNAPSTFLTKAAAEAWLTHEREQLENPETYKPPAERLAETRAAEEARRRDTFGAFAETFLAARKVKGRPLADRTRTNYRALLDDHILPTFEDVPLSAVTRPMVATWYDTVAPGHATTQANAYSLLRTILNDAVDRDRIPYNPCRVRGAGRKPDRAKVVKVASPDELAAIAAAMPERRRLMVLLAGWCALRYGEVAELRRGDIDLAAKPPVIRVRRAVVWPRDGRPPVVKATKTNAGLRDVVIPRHLVPLLKNHLGSYVSGKNGLLFPAAHGGHLSTVKDSYGKARTAAGRPDLPFHDLRHTALTHAAQEGATLAELKELAGHADVSSVMIYQHATPERMEKLADKLADRATAKKKPARRPAKDRGSKAS